MKKLVLFVTSLVLSIACLAQNYPHRSDVLWITSPDHQDWLYQLNEEVKISVSLYQYGMPLDDIKVEYSFGPEMMPASQSGALVLEEGKGALSFAGSPRPGFIDCQFSVTLDGEEYKHHIKVGFEPQQLKPYTALPKDFVSYWELSKKEAQLCPMLVSKEFVPAYSSSLVDCFLVKIQAYQKGNFVYGYLTIPKKAGKFPVVFSPPGAGIKPMDPLKHLFYAENGFIRFDMEIHGIRPDLDAATYQEIAQAFGRGDNSYLVNGLDNRDSYYMKKAYLACLRAIDYLSTLPEWDGKNLIAQGGSQGGALALIATGLDSRITACAANHPALSDMAGYKDNRAGGYPHLFTKFEGMDTPEKLSTLQYYDVVNFAQLIKVPVFMTWGYNDNTCPPTTSYIVYNILKTKKEALITPVNEHWVSTATRYRILEWIKMNLK